jgi:hypothetical protein
VFHARAAAIYFTLLIALHLGARLLAGDQPGTALGGSAWQFALSALTVGTLTLMGYIYGRATLYTLTNRRLVVRTGVAVPMMINVPLERLAAADLRVHRDGSGDVALTPAPGVRLAFWALWPNIRPWHYRPVCPSLRCLPEPERAARCLAEAVGADAATTSRAKAPDERLPVAISRVATVS